jgi:hypothetical protein
MRISVGGKVKSTPLPSIMEKSKHMWLPFIIRETSIEFRPPPDTQLIVMNQAVMKVVF